jgi:hypothetical protein
MEVLCVVPGFETRLRFPHLVSGTTNCLNVALRVSFLSYVATEIFLSSSFTDHVEARYLLVCNRLLSSSNNWFSFDTLFNTRTIKPLSITFTLKMSTATFSETTENP